MIVRCYKWTPIRLSNLRLWLDASNVSKITKDGSNFVSSWRSQEGNNYDFAQATASRQPQWFSTGFATPSKSKPYIQFDGVDDMLKVSVANAFSGDSQGTVVLVCSNSNPPTNNINAIFLTSADEGATITTGSYIGFESYPNSSVLYASVNQRKTGTLNRVRASGGNSVDTNEVVFYFIRSTGTAFTFRKNLTAVGTTITTGANNGDWFSDIPNRDNLTLGSIQASNAGFYFCRIAEVIVTGTNIVDGSLEQIYLEQYLKTKYGTPNVS